MISKKDLKKKVFTNIPKDFSTEITNSNGLSGRKQVISKKKKGLHPKYVMKSGVSPQKLQKYRWQTPIWASICIPVAPSLLISSGHCPRLGGHKQSFGGHGPEMPPVAPGLDSLKIHLIQIAVNYEIGNPFNLLNFYLNKVSP